MLQRRPSLIKLKLLPLKTLKPTKLTLFTRQLGILLEAGLPLLHSLELLKEQEHSSLLQTTITGLIEYIETGNTFSDALAAHPYVFNNLYINMVKVGELGGVLGLVLTRLADYQEKDQKLQMKLLAAMCYPIIVLLLAIAILTFLFTFIVPKFELIFADMLNGQSLPLLTQIVLTISHAITHHLIFIAASLALPIGLYVWIRNTTKGKHLFDSWLLQIPWFGNLTRKRAIARFTDTLGILTTSGVPLLKSLTITKQTINNLAIVHAINEIHDAIKEGESIVQPLKACGVFPPMATSLITIGEETAQLSEMLQKVADIYNDEVDAALVILTAAVEPVMIIFLAVIVGTIVIALFLPLISMISGLQQ